MYKNIWQSLFSTSFCAWSDDARGEVGGPAAAAGAGLGAESAWSDAAAGQPRGERAKTSKVPRTLSKDSDIYILNASLT